MARVQFACTVKYRGEWFPAHTPFQCLDKDVDSLVIKGATVLEPARCAPKDNKDKPEEMREESSEYVNEDEGTNEQDIAELLTKTELLSLKKSELISYAQSIGVDISDCTNNEQRVLKIVQSYK